MATSTIKQLLKIIEIPSSEFTWHNATKQFVSSNTHQPPTGQKLLGFMVTCTNSGGTIMSGTYGSSGYEVHVGGINPDGTLINDTYHFRCYMILM